MDALFEWLAEGSAAGPLIAFAIGILLGFSPVALPSLPVVVGALAPGRLDQDGLRRPQHWFRIVPSVFAFAFGLNGVLGILGYLFTSVSVALARSSVVLYAVAALVLGVLGFRLVTRRTSLCKRAETIPPKPLSALLYGVGFSIGGCPGCGPLAIGIGAAAALVGGPAYGMIIILTFVAGHAAVMILAAVVGSRILPFGTSKVPWPRLDLIVGLMMLAAAAYYAFQLASGRVTTYLPGEAGSGLLP
jgi:cytochrome c biogenesis protein CcdA